jgi:hypothetical protein
LITCQYSSTLANFAFGFSEEIKIGVDDASRLLAASNDQLADHPSPLVSAIDSKINEFFVPVT